MIENKDTNKELFEIIRTIGKIIGWNISEDDCWYTDIDIELNICSDIPISGGLYRSNNYTHANGLNDYFSKDNQVDFFWQKQSMLKMVKVRWKE